MDSRDGAIIDARHIIREFLMENGGMDNGYDTWVDGEVPGTLTWHTETSDDLTVKRARELARRLSKRLGESLRCFKLQLCARPIGNGCYETTIRRVETEALAFP